MHVTENFQSTQSIEELELCLTSMTKLDAGIKFISINLLMKPLIVPQKFRKQREVQVISLLWPKIPIRLLHALQATLDYHPEPRILVQHRHFQVDQRSQCSPHWPTTVRFKE